MIQIVDLTGVAGLSFLIAFCNLMAVIIVRRITSELGPVFLKRVRWEFSLTMALIAAVFSYGVRSLLQKGPTRTETLRVAVIQPNIAQSEKFSGEAQDRVMEQIGQLTELAASSQPHLILWPESATPGGLYSSQSIHDLVMDLVTQGDFSLLVGTVAADLASREDYNTATLLTEHGTQIQSYRKMHLVPFGEYLPFRQSFPLFAMVAGDLVPGDFTPGHDFTVLSLPKPALKFSALICFEDTLGDLTRQFVQNGAQLLVNITNDGWFLKTAGAEQHLANSIFRAVENRRPLVRCANTGVSALIDPNGHVDRLSLHPFESGFAVREFQVPAADTPLTFYSRHGEWFIHGCVILCALQIALSLARKRP
jgi:apolipoprotein N-acyltransferase